MSRRSNDGAAELRASQPHSNQLQMKNTSYDMPMLQCQKDSAASVAHQLQG
jgi:hypothetical protein